MARNRGMLLEKLINKTILFYNKNNIGLFHKKVIPIRFKKIESNNNKLLIKDGIIVDKSTTDYYGVYNGIFIAFEAKSTDLKFLPMNNIKKHQHKYLKKIEELGGISFYIIGFKEENKYFLVLPKVIENNNGTQIKIQYLEKTGYSIELEYPGILDFLAIIQKLI